MAKAYWEKLKDPRWQRKRLEAMQASGFNCDQCGDDESMLHVHHKQYFKGREPWEYEIGQLSVLCAACHEMQHELEDGLNLICSYLPLDGPRSRSLMASFVAGYAGLKCRDDFYDPMVYCEGEISHSLFSRNSSLRMSQLSAIADCAELHGDEMAKLLSDFAKSKGFD